MKMEQTCCHRWCCGGAGKGEFKLYHFSDAKVEQHAHTHPYHTNHAIVAQAGENPVTFTVNKDAVQVFKDFAMQVS